jgi:hypothetical protein
MKKIVRTLTRPSLLAAMALVAVLPLGATAQSSLNTSEATAFLGSWSLSFESPMGELVMDLNVTDQSGKVAASMGSDMLGGMQNVTNITKSGADLVLRYELDAQGQLVPVAVTLTVNGSAITAEMDFADGMFQMSCAGTKKAE